MRLNSASMLISNGVAIGEAASRCGYVSASQFSREFKRQYGVTPREWSNSADDSGEDI